MQCPAPDFTDFVVQFRQLNLHLLSLEEVVLGLLAHGRYHVELPGHGVGFLEERNQQKARHSPRGSRGGYPNKPPPEQPLERGGASTGDVSLP